MFRVRDDSRPGAVGGRDRSSAGRGPGVGYTSVQQRRRRRPYRSTDSTRTGHCRPCEARRRRRSQRPDGRGPGKADAAETQTADSAAGQVGARHGRQARGRRQARSQGGRSGRQSVGRGRGRPQGRFQSGQGYGESGHRARRQGGAAQLLVPGTPSREGKIRKAQRAKVSVGFRAIRE